jgi:hypothetical protein
MKHKFVPYLHSISFSKWSPVYTSLIPEVSLLMCVIHFRVLSTVSLSSSLLLLSSRSIDSHSTRFDLGFCFKYTMWLRLWFINITPFECQLNWYTVYTFSQVHRVQTSALQTHNIAFSINKSVIFVSMQDKVR